MLLPRQHASTRFANPIFQLRANYARSLYIDDDATLDDLREAVTTLEDVAPITRRVLGGAHPLVQSIERHLRAALAARETPSANA